MSWVSSCFVWAIASHHAFRSYLLLCKRITAPIVIAFIFIPFVVFFLRQVYLYIICICFIFLLNIISLIYSELV